MRYIPFFLLLSIGLFGQGKKAPKGFISIEANAENFARLMADESPSQEVLDTMVQLGRLYALGQRDTALLIIEKIIFHSKDLKSKKGQNTYAKSLSSKGSALGADGLETLLEARVAFEKIENRRGVASTDRLLGLLYLNKGQLKESMDAYLSCIKIYKEEKTDPRAFLSPLEGISDIYFSMGDYENSQRYLSEAIIIADTTDSGYRESALRHGKASLIFEIANVYSERADTSNNLMYRDSAQLFYQKALADADTALIVAKEHANPSDLLHNYEILSRFNNQLGYFQKARKYAKDAIGLAEKNGEVNLLVINKYHLAMAHNGLREFKTAIPIAEEALAISNKENLFVESQKINDSLIELYISTGQSEKALLVLKDKTKLSRKQNTIETKKAIVEVEIKYETAKKEKEILQQRNDILELESTNAKIQKQKNYIMGGGLLFSLLGFLGYRFNKIQKDRNDKREFAEALIFAQEEERKRISRDLHDGVGQSLLLIKKQLEGAREVTLENQKMISDTLEEVRSISRDLHPFQLDKFGLTATINDTILKIEESTELFITKDIDDIDKVLESKSEIHLYRTIQEALSNIVKHAQATAAKVSIKNEENRIQVMIQDNGKGFDLEMAVVASKSLGIRTMHERISAIGGDLKITKGGNEGTKVTVTIPKSKD